MILDIGCGFAKETNLDLFRYKANPKGDVNVDIGIPDAKIKNYVRCDASYLCFRDESFDKVIASHVLEHLKNPLSCLTEGKRVLKERGFFEAYVPNRIAEIGGGHDPNHLWHWDKNTFKKLVGMFFSDVKLTRGGGCWIPIKGNVRLWGNYIIKIFPFLANELKVKAQKIG
jgi:SAM-dependent methyltransferase